MDDLKPCPFCGGPAELDTHRPFLALSSGKPGTGISVYCTGACPAEVMLCRGDVDGLTPEMVIDLWNCRMPAPRAVAFDGADLRESNLAMMIRRLCSMRIDGTFAITEQKRDEALALLRSMGLQGSPLRSSDAGVSVPQPPGSGKAESSPTERGR
jgi:hypothetical protein